MRTILHALAVIGTLLLLRLEDNWFFHNKQEQYCERYCGHCEKCDCWSCKRKEYIDLYKDQISKEYINYREEE